MLPSIFGENLFDEFFGDWDREMRRMDRQLYGKNAAREMKTDVHEHEDHYEVDIDLPGFKKEDITLELQNGLSPIVFTPCDKKNDFAYMVLPVRLRSNS